jgi:hypothetical protein
MRIPRHAVAASLVLAVAGCAAPRPPSAGAGPAVGQVLVRLMHHERAVPGAEMSAVRNLGVARLEERQVALAGADGHARLQLAPGIWYLSAAAAAPAIAGWYGSNPIQVRAGETIDVTIPAVPADAAPVSTPVAPGDEAVAGEVVGDGKAVGGAAVAFYLDAATQFRGPGYVEVRTDERGAFEARLSPGRYWIFVRRRSGPQAFGPLEAGDDFGFFPANPLEVRSGERLALRIPAVRVLKKSGWSGPSTLRTRVSGTVRDAAGHPLPGYRAFLHAQAAMLGKPDFVSEPSGADGAYLIWVDREGVYYLGARAEIGRAREQRDLIGEYAGTPDHAIAVRLGAADLPGLDIVVNKGGPVP